MRGGMPVAPCPSIVCVWGCDHLAIAPPRHLAASYSPLLAKCLQRALPRRLKARARHRAPPPLLHSCLVETQSYRRRSISTTRPTLCRARCATSQTRCWPSISTSTSPCGSTAARSSLATASPITSGRSACSAGGSVCRSCSETTCAAWAATPPPSPSKTTTRDSSSPRVPGVRLPRDHARSPTRD